MPAVLFRLPPMSPMMRTLTFIMLALPLLLGAMGYFASSQVLLNIAGLIILLVIGVWLGMRPTGYEVDSTSLTLRWPIRSKKFPKNRILAARIVGTDELRAELGQAMRIGVGGLFGAFGYLWTSNRGMVEFYITGQDRFVLIDLRGGKTLLLSVERPEEFVNALALDS